MIGGLRVNVSERLSKLIKQSDYTFEQLEELSGVKKSSLQRYASGQTKKIPVDALKKIAPHIKTTPAYLMGWDEPAASTPPEHTLVNFPVVGSISAGYTGVAAEEYTGECVPITLAALHGPLDEYFVLRVSGDSMYPYLLNGDLVLVHRATMVENGKVAVVLYNGDEATVKRVRYKVGEYIELVPSNPEYKTRRIQGEDLNECRILGEVVKLMRDVM